MSTSTLTRPARSQRSRRSSDPANRPQPTTPIFIISVVADGSVLNITFDQPVILNGLPNFLPDTGETPVSMERISATEVAITYTGDVEMIHNLGIGFQDPAIRNASGGFVTSDTFTL